MSDSSIPSSPPSEKRASAWLVFAIPALVGLGLGSFTLGGSFVFDSKQIVLENPRLDSLGSLPGLFVDNYWGDYVQGGLYRPLVLVTFGIERALFGTTAWPYHLCNAILYGAVCGLVGRWLLSLGSRPRFALLGALFFAAHPIHTEPVANLVGRAELLALGGALGLWLAARSSRPVVRVWGVVAFAVGMFSKESAIAALPILALVPLFERGDGRWLERLREGNRRQLRLWLGCAAVIAVWFVLRSIALDGEPQPPTELDNILAHRSALGRIAGALDVTLLYHLKMLVPWPLSADYSLNAILPADQLYRVGALGGAAVLFGFSALIAKVARRRPAESALWGAALTVYLLPLLVVANLFFATGTVFAERLLFAPSAGLCAAVAASLAWFRRRHPRIDGIATIGVGILVIAGSVAFAIRCRDWRSERSIAEAITRAQPASAKGHEKLGHEIYVEATREENRPRREQLLAIARSELEQSIELYDEYGNAHYHRALVARLQADLDAWLESSERRWQVEWKMPGQRGPAYDASLDLARARLRMIKSGRGDAQSHLRRALEVCAAALSRFGNSADVLQVQAEALLIAGKANEASPILEALRRASPDDRSLAPLLAHLYFVQGNLEAARRELDRAIDLPPDDPHYSALATERISFLNNRALVWEKLGRLEQVEADRQTIRTIMEAKILELVGADELDEARDYLESNQQFAKPSDREALRQRIPTR
ncbi:MAG: tetratricopeptide repeat protein [Planctomycetes bacterium]|nr:tetratricopeptide repeat protein [Planctomycetota bacterium]